MNHVLSHNNLNRTSDVTQADADAHRRLIHSLVASEGLTWEFKANKPRVYNAKRLKKTKSMSQA